MDDFVAEYYEKICGINKPIYSYSLPSVTGAKNSHMLLIYFII